MGIEINSSKCVYCAGCVSVCPVLALTLNETKIVCDFAKCVDCSICMKACPVQAIKLAKNKK